MRKRWVALMGCVIALASAGPSLAAGSQDEFLRKIESLEQQLKELKEIQKAAGEKKSQCMQAFGGEKFCTCLGENLPREVGLERYVHTVITPREVLGYDAMSPEQKKAVDQTIGARDKCVENVKGGTLW